MTDFWKHPADEPPPQGEKVVLYTTTGIAIMGHWRNEDCVLWAPLPKLSKELKTRLDSERPGLFGLKSTKAYLSL